MARRYWQVFVCYLLLLACRAESCDREPALDERAKKLVREYVIFNYRSIANDILNGAGAYLDALLLNLKICHRDQSAALLELRAILAETQHPASFAIAVVTALAPATAPDSPPY